MARSRDVMEAYTRPLRPMSAEKLKVRRELLAQIDDALRQRVTLAWGDGNRRTWTPVLRGLGVALVSKTKAEQLGHRIRRGAVPVVNAYFGAPLQRHADLYLLGAQTRFVGVRSTKKPAVTVDDGPTDPLAQPPLPLAP